MRLFDAGRKKNAAGPATRVASVLIRLMCGEGANNLVNSGVKLGKIQRTSPWVKLNQQTYLGVTWGAPTLSAVTSTWLITMGVYPEKIAGASARARTNASK